MNQSAHLSFPNLLAILLSIVVVMAPHAPHVPKWTVAFCLIALLIRLYAGLKRRPLPAKPLLFSFAAVAIGGVLFSFGSLFGRDSAITLLLAMTVLKLLEMRSQRDVTVTVVLCYFLAITNFFYTQTIFTALYSIGAAWLITGTMVSLQHRARPAKFLQVMRMSGLLLAQAVPVMLVLFLLFPRIEGPLWGLPKIQNSGRTGLSDRMSPGSLSRLSLSDEIAFRADFETPPEDAKKLYWRGPVLWDYDGRNWAAGQRIPLSSFRYDSFAPNLKYSVTLEPHDQRWLYLVDLPSRLPQKSILTRDYQVVSFSPVRQRLRYSAESTPVYRAGTEALPAELQRALALPPDAAPRTRAMVRQWRGLGLSGMEIAQRVLSIYREQPFIYTLEPPPLPKDPVDQFLFETRRGFCEHFASSFAVMMRAAGVPTRVVTGYLGGEINPVDGYLVVRQSEAHAWNEIWTPDEGWVRVDPTAAVSPLRIERGLANAVPDTDPQPLFRRTQLKWLVELRYQWDAVTNAWNQWVLGYTLERQTRFLSTFGFSNVGWQDMIITLLIATGIILSAFALGMFMRLRSNKTDAVQRLWLHYCNVMAARGVVRKTSEGPKDFTQRVAKRFPGLRERVVRIGELYIDLRYGKADAPSEQSTPRMRELRTHIRALYLAASPAGKTS
jgi:transglutaminase-like putative cysteine protease